MGKALAPWAAAWRTSGLCVQPSPGPGKRPPHPQQGLRITLYIYHAPSGCLVHHAVSLSPTPSLASWRERQRRGGLGAHCKLGRAAGNNHKVQAPGWDWRGYDSFPRPASVLRLAHSHLSALWVPGPACPAAEGGRVSGVMDASSCSPLDLSSLSLQPWAGGPSPDQVAPCQGPACLAHLPVLGPVGSTSVAIIPMPALGSPLLALHRPWVQGASCAWWGHSCNPAGVRGLSEATPGAMLSSAILGGVTASLWASAVSARRDWHQLLGRKGGHYREGTGPLAGGRP